jgi:hypothetical protein
MRAVYFRPKRIEPVNADYFYQPRQESLFSEIKILQICELRKAKRDDVSTERVSGRGPFGLSQ